jgi:hypothetical protein
MDALELMAQLAAGEDLFDLGFVLADLPAPLRPEIRDETDDVEDEPVDVPDEEPPDGRRPGAGGLPTDARSTNARPTGEETAGEPSAADGPATPNGPPGTAGGGRSPRRRKRRYRPRGPKAGGVVAVVDFAALRRGQCLPGERCEIPGIGPVPVAAALELLGEGALRLVLTDGVDVRTVAHTRRRPSAHQLTALLARYHECCVAGCSSRVALQDDHDDPWARTHETWLPNLKRVCPHHHGRKTHQGWDWVVEDPDPVTGKHRLVPPHHPDHPARAGRAKPRPPTTSAA